MPGPELKTSPALLAALREHFLDGVWGLLLASPGCATGSTTQTRHPFATWLLSEDADLRLVQQRPILANRARNPLIL